MENAAVALASLLVLSMSCTPTPEDWGQASSAYVERCEGEACAQGNECAGGYCLKPEDAGDDYRPGLRCGDGLVQRWEDCDDGNDINTDNCLTGCRAARCGDGFVRAHLTIHDPEYEACDDGNLDDNDGCTSECRLARCGDGFVRADLSLAKTAMKPAMTAIGSRAMRALTVSRRAAATGSFTTASRPAMTATRSSTMAAWRTASLRAAVTGTYARTSSPVVSVTSSATMATKTPRTRAETTATRTLCRRGSGRDQTIWRTAAGRFLRRTLKRVTGSTGWT